MRTWRGGESFRAGRAFLVRLHLNIPDQSGLLQNLHSLCVANDLRWIPWRPPFVGVFICLSGEAARASGKSAQGYQYIGLIF